MGQNNILFELAGCIAKQIREGEISSYQMVLAYFEQIEKQNNLYNILTYFLASLMAVSSSFLNVCASFSL